MKKLIALAFLSFVLVSCEDCLCKKENHANLVRYVDKKVEDLHEDEYTKIYFKNEDGAIGKFFSVMKTSEGYIYEGTYNDFFVPFNKKDTEPTIKECENNGGKDSNDHQDIGGNCTVNINEKNMSDK